MITPLAYSPPKGPLAEVRPTVALAFLVLPAAIATAFASPILLAGCALAVAIQAAGAGARRQLRRATRGALLLGAVIVVVNALVVRRGETVLWRGPDPPILGPVDVTAEAALEGAIIAARIVVVIGAFAIVTARVDPDYLLRSLRRIARRSALTATLLVRLVPLAVADLSRLREAAALRGPGAIPVSRVMMLRRLISGTLDRAVDSAAALEVRGYGHAASRPAPRRKRWRRDRLFGSVTLAAAILVVIARVAGAGGFDAYPTPALDLDPVTVALALAIPAAAAIPFAIPRHRRWRGPGTEVSGASGGSR